ncbi:MAG: hypothetical protein GF421_11810 [Candidatus Aminicenantes bacterium]|nr:hypothetical protein [Candidatus Aminicenantes bacterium]
MDRPIIAFLTDFGDQDFFTAAMKGVVAQINPEARTMDITNKIPHFDVTAAAFILKASYRYFPSDTIFVVVVDPGVGTSRRILIAESTDYYFVAPDNGVLSWVIKENKEMTIREVSSEHYFIPRKGRTFEGRDKMAPLAAWISRGVYTENFGPIANDYKQVIIDIPEREGNQIWGRIIYQDGFGNLITNISERDYLELAKRTEESSILISLNQREIPIRQSYHSVEKGELVAILSGQGFVEIAKREGSAAEETKSKPGDPVMLAVKDR